MAFMKRGWAAAVVACLLPAAAAAQGTPPGTAAFGAGGSYGNILGDSRFGNDFSTGGGYNLLLRYVASEHVSLQANFQNQSYSYDGVVAADEEVPITRLVTTSFEASMLFFRNRNADASQYFTVGLGLYRPEIRLEEDPNYPSALFPGENFMFFGGLGVELFLRENWAIDIQARGIGYVGDGIADQEEGTIEPTGNNISFGLVGQAALVYFILK